MHAYNVNGGGPLEVLIRPEDDSDGAQIDALHRAAFGGPDEAALVAALRNEGEILLSLVAIQNKRLVGRVVLSQTYVEGAQGIAKIAWLAPLAVLPEAQHGGIGSALATSGIRCCRELNIGYVVVVGDEGFYSRFGFSRKAAKGLESRWPPNALLLAQPLVRMPEIHGRLVEPKAFARLE